MRNKLTALLVGLALSVGVAQAGDKDFLFNYNENLASATSFTILSAVAGVKYRIQGLELSTDVAGVYTLRCGASTTKGKWNLSNNGGFLVEYINVNKICAPGDGVFIDKPSNGNTYVSIWYDRR